MPANAVIAQRTDSTAAEAARPSGAAADIRADSMVIPRPPSPAEGREHEVAGTEQTHAPVATSEPRAESVSATGGGKRARWTRETVISELASWIMSSTAIDAAFLKRHGPPGLVPASVRIFGRFDAALNVAGLHVAKLYPEGPPNRSPRGGGSPSRSGTGKGPSTGLPSDGDS
jgi:hypothetical protein